MCGTMTVLDEVFPLTVDINGIWDLAGTPGSWQSDIIMADSDMHWETQFLLRANGISDDQVINLHSTNCSEPGAFWSSWHPDGTSIVHTYMAAVKSPDGYVPETWPQARPVTVELFNAVGKPDEYDPTEPPAPREVHVLFHGLRHLHNLVITDTRNAEALGELWARHLEPFEPVLATMFHRQRAAQT